MIKQFNGWKIVRYFGFGQYEVLNPDGSTSSLSYNQIQDNPGPYTGVAQQSEQGSLKSKVAGSNPAASTININTELPMIDEESVCALKKTTDGYSPSSFEKQETLPKYIFIDNDLKLNSDWVKQLKSMLN